MSKVAMRQLGFIRAHDANGTASKTCHRRPGWHETAQLTLLNGSNALLPHCWPARERLAYGFDVLLAGTGIRSRHSCVQFRHRYFVSTCLPPSIFWGFNRLPRSEHVIGLLALGTATTRSHERIHAAGSRVYRSGDIGKPGGGTLKPLRLSVRPFSKGSQSVSAPLPPPSRSRRLYPSGSCARHRG